MSFLDTTPPDPAAPDFFTELAARDTPAALRLLGNESASEAPDPGPGHRAVPARRLAEVLGRRGHSGAAAAWAVHRLVQRGLLAAEVATPTERPGAGRPVRPPLLPAGRPVPHDLLLVRPTPALWRWRPEEAGRAGPPFTAADFDRATAALDLVLQDYDWQAGDNRFVPEALAAALRRRGITNALLLELLLRLATRGVFRPWSETSPAGYHCVDSGPRPLYRTISRTTYRLVTYSERWYGYLDDRRAQAEAGATQVLGPPAPEPPARPLPAGPAAPAGAGEPFIPSQLQGKILRALVGKALTLDALALKLGVDRSSVYRRGLKELKLRGLVANRRRVGGYFRPDAPPPEYAALLGRAPG
jgi:hypothetical protein